MDRVLAGLMSAQQHPRPVGTPHLAANTQRTIASPLTLVGALQALARGDPLRSSGVSPEVARRADEAEQRVRAARHQRRGSAPRGIAGATAMADFAITCGSADTAFSLEALDDLALAFADDRVRTQRVSPATVAEQLSAVASAFRTAGLGAVPPYLGPRARGYVKSRGAGQRREQSNALPLSLAWLLSVRPAPSSPDYDVWQSRVVQSGFMLRPGLATKLCHHNMTAWGGGYILTWAAPDKTRQGDVCTPGDAIQPTWRITGCAHPAVVAVLDEVMAKSKGRASLWPLVTPRRVMEWLRRTRIVRDSEVPRLTAHGFRLGTDQELDQLKVPPDIINVIGYWARETTAGKSTRSYYNSIHVGAMYLATSRLGSALICHPGAGVHVGREAKPIDWARDYPRYLEGLPQDLPRIRLAIMEGDTDSSSSDSD